MVRLGYTKVIDLFACEADAKKGYTVPGRFLYFRDTLLRRRPGLTVRKLGAIADRDAILFVKEGGKQVGYCLGFVALFAGIRKVVDFRLWALAVLPEYSRMGLDVQLYPSICEDLARRGVRLEADWVLDNNRRMLNALEKPGLIRTKVYGICEMPLP
jgi:ribosomal protein S18 acetylase RimI-like enzyme